MKFSKLFFAAILLLVGICLATWFVMEFTGKEKVLGWKVEGGDSSGAEIKFLKVEKAFFNDKKAYLPGRFFGYFEFTNRTAEIFVLNGNRDPLGVFIPHITCYYVKYKNRGGGAWEQPLRPPASYLVGPVNVTLLPEQTLKFKVDLCEIADKDPSEHVFRIVLMLTTKNLEKRVDYFSEVFVLNCEKGR